MTGRGELVLIATTSLPLVSLTADDVMLRYVVSKDTASSGNSLIFSMSDLSSVNISMVESFTSTRSPPDSITESVPFASLSNVSCLGSRELACTVSLK